MWVPIEGPILYKSEPKTPSTALSMGAVVDIVSGQVAVASASGQSHAGICQRDVLSTDADYADATPILMIVPMHPNCTFQVDVEPGDTLALTDVDTFFDLAGTPVGMTLTNSGVSHNAALCKSVNLTAQQITAYLNSYKPMQNGS